MRTSLGEAPFWGPKTNADPFRPIKGFSTSVRILFQFPSKANQLQPYQ
jgi:hypothetical protein